MSAPTIAERLQDAVGAFVDAVVKMREDDLPSTLAAYRAGLATRVAMSDARLSTLDVLAAAGADAGSFLRPLADAGEPCLEEFDQWLWLAEQQLQEMGVDTDAIRREYR